MKALFFAAGAGGGACGSLSTDQVPTMTSNTAPSGTASAADETYELAWKSFNNATGVGWTSLAVTGAIIYDFGSGNGFICKGYSLSAATVNRARMAKDWTLEGANGGAYTTLDTVTGETAWSADEKRSYSAIADADFSNDTSYYQYKINVSANNGSGGALEIGEIELYECGD
tara:strand:+ start:3742 stop:4257 length:516 start_codon:yes stop_codon:yes gene_type:complete